MTSSDRSLQNQQGKNILKQMHVGWLVNSPPILKPIFVGIESDVHWGLTGVLTQSHVDEGRRLFGPRLRKGGLNVLSVFRAQEKQADKGTLNEHSHGQLHLIPENWLVTVLLRQAFGSGYLT